MSENPVCDKCGNEYDPRIIQVERTLFSADGALPQWKCDSCDNWVDLREFLHKQRNIKDHQSNQKGIE